MPLRRVTETKLAFDPPPSPPSALMTRLHTNLISKLVFVLFVFVSFTGKNENQGEYT